MGCGVGHQNLASRSITPRALIQSSGRFVSENIKTFKQCYKISEELGAGAYATVMSATHKTSGISRAVKIIPKSRITSKVARETFLHEVEILRQMDHPNIVRVYEYFQDEKYIYIVMELCTGGELLDIILRKKVLSEQQAARYMQQILSGVVYCHAKHIVHRDLKPENLIFQSDSSDSLLKIIDFGTSVLHTPRKKLKRRLGTIYYLAPEVLKCSYDEKCDVWSCGVILFVLLSGKMPFMGEDDEEIFRKIEEGLFSMEGLEWAEVSEGAQQLVRKMLKVDPRKRATAEQIFYDPWVQQAAVPVPERNYFSAVMTNLSSFNARNKLQRAMLAFIAQHLLNKEETAELTQVFRAMDRTGVGRISQKELKLCVYDVLGVTFPEDMITEILQKVDIDESGFIDYSEFLVAAMDKEKLLSAERLNAAFALLDKDGNGKISRSELKAILDVDSMHEDRLWADLIATVDQNGDGDIDLSEFRDMMLQTL